MADEGQVNNESKTGANSPDLFLMGKLGDRMTDKGPRYTETPRDPFAADAPSIAEPFNTATAFLFVVLVFAWVWKLSGRFRQFPFLTSSLPVLFVGAVGGTLYHATRTRPLYFYLDVADL